MARQADVAAGMEASTGGGQFFSTRGGILSFNDMPIPGNRMAVVIADAALENVFYEGKFDAATPKPPTCFAFGRDEAAMAPHETVVAAGQAQAATCGECPLNEWASAETGRGKACRNTRRLALVSAGELDDRGAFTPYEDRHFETSPLAFLKLPVTSVRGYSTYVKQIAGALRRPAYGVFTEVKVVQDAKTQFRILFSPLGSVPASLMSAVSARHSEAEKSIEFPYKLDFEEPAAPPPPKTAARGTVGRATAPRAAGKKF